MKTWNGWKEKYEVIGDVRGVGCMAGIEYVTDKKSKTPNASLVNDNHQLRCPEGTSANANLMWAKNGLDAVDIVKNNNRIDLILMDINMPKLDGIEATRIIKNLILKLLLSFKQLLYSQEKKECVRMLVVTSSLPSLSV